MKAARCRRQRGSRALSVCAGGIPSTRLGLARLFQASTTPNHRAPGLWNRFLQWLQATAGGFLLAPLVWFPRLTPLVTRTLMKLTLTGTVVAQEEKGALQEAVESAVGSLGRVKLRGSLQAGVTFTPDEARDRQIFGRLFDDRPNEPRLNGLSP